MRKQFRLLLGASALSVVVACLNAYAPVAHTSSDHESNKSSDPFRALPGWQPEESSSVGLEDLHQAPLATSRLNEPVGSRLFYRGGPGNELYSMSPDGGDVRQLTLTSVYTKGFVADAAHDRIAVTDAWADCESPHGSQILVMDFDGGNRQSYRPFDTYHGCSVPRDWSIPGRPMLVEYSGVLLTNIALFNPATRSAQRVTHHDPESDSYSTLPAWIDHGRRFIDASGRIYDASGSATGKQFRFGGENVRITEYAVSPDTHHVAAVVDDRSLVVMRTDGRDRRVVASIAGRYSTLGNVGWSPDGTRLVFAMTDCCTSADDDLGPPLVLTVRADGSGLRTLVAGGFSPRWAPDGHSLAFAGIRGVGNRGIADEQEALFRVDVDGAHLSRLGAWATNLLLFSWLSPPG